QPRPGDRGRGVPVPEPRRERSSVSLESALVTELRLGQTSGTQTEADQQQTFTGRKPEPALHRLIRGRERPVAASAATERKSGVQHGRPPSQAHPSRIEARALRASTSHLGGRPRRGRSSSSQPTGGYTRTVLTSSGYGLPPQARQRSRLQSAT